VAAGAVAEVYVGAGGPAGEGAADGVRELLTHLGERYDYCMRTHIELSESKLRALRDLAARRGLRGYSRLVAEAVDEYLERHGRALVEDRAAKIARLEGSLSDLDEKVMRRTVREIRKEKA
jgi:hypothetical protein